MTIADLPAVDATLNGISAALLVAGYVNIRLGRVRSHAACMLSAVVISTVFLACYLTYHIHRTYVSGLGPTRFGGAGMIRPVYFTILISHTILAVATVPLVLTTVYRAARGRFDMHKRIARWTFPIWLYVSLTGVVVYWMLYHAYRPS